MQEEHNREGDMKLGKTRNKIKVNVLLNGFVQFDCSQLVWLYSPKRKIHFNTHQFNGQKVCLLRQASLQL